MHPKMFLLVLGMLALSGCQGPMLSQAGSDTARIDSFYDYGAAGRDLQLVVYGNPFSPGMSDDAFASLIEDKIDHVNVARQQTHPQLVPDDSVRSGYTLVFGFQPEATVDGDRLCHAQFAAGPAGSLGNGVELWGEEAGLTMRAIAAFCVAGRAETEIVGQTQVVSPDDPRMNDLLNQMMQAVFRPDRHGCYRRGFCM